MATKVTATGAEPAYTDCRKSEIFLSLRRRTLFLLLWFQPPKTFKASSKLNSRAEFWANGLVT
ncbi:MAG: hypothetical protein HC916_01920 [Coleofasciculaceae cyanobacterium SM2_1_6]|nr:hypothetical protein [Coleofasciculaceae cyanobacterium SM2_1_6]